VLEAPLSLCRDTPTLAPRQPVARAKAPVKPTIPNAGALSFRGNLPRTCGGRRASPTSRQAKLGCKLGWLMVLFIRRWPKTIEPMKAFLPGLGSVRHGYALASPFWSDVTLRSRRGNGEAGATGARLIRCSPSRPSNPMRSRHCSAGEPESAGRPCVPDDHIYLDYGRQTRVAAAQPADGAVFAIRDQLTRVKIEVRSMLTQLLPRPCLAGSRCARRQPVEGRPGHRTWSVREFAGSRSLRLARAAARLRQSARYL